MKKRLHDKKAGIAILISLIIISLAEVILRSVILKEAMFNLANAGEPIITAAISLLLLTFALKGKDRVFYILCGIWLGFFVLNQLYGLPGMIADTIERFGAGSLNTAMCNLIHVLSMICIVVIGALLVEYMNDGSIYNKAFNILCAITLVLLLLLALHNGVYDALVLGRTEVILASIHNLSRMAMIFLFTFFAYDSAKAQLQKTDLSK
jgi:hypothetical protein